MSVEKNVTYEVTIYIIMLWVDRNFGRFSKMVNDDFRESVVCVASENYNYIAIIICSQLQKL